MIRIISIIWLAASLAGCTTTDSGRWWREMTGVEPAAGNYHFDWRLSGDQDLAPLQVFDDGQDTWLQYPANQAAPALFARFVTGDRLLRPRREGDYLVINGVYDHLLMRGGLLQAEARRQTSMTSTMGSPDALTSDAPVALAATGLSVAASSSPPPAAMTSPLSNSVPGVARPSTALASIAPPPPPRPVPAAVSVASSAASATASAKRPPPVMSASQAPAPAPFEVTPADGNVRRALGRWARTAGWAFDAEHWAVDVDIPLAGSAIFDEPFRGAVRSLLAATELGDRPVQPCFYANQVLRVVPLAQRCDRTQGPGAAS